MVDETDDAVGYGAPVEAEEMRSSQTPRWQVVREGLVGGVVATAVMTLYRVPVFRSLPPTTEFWAQYVQSGEPEEFLPEGILLHAVYGAVAGAVGSVLYGAGVGTTDLDRRWFGVVGGALYGAALSAFGIEVMVGLLLDEELDREETFVFHVGHLVFGLSLGTWLGTGQTLSDVYE